MRRLRLRLGIAGLMALIGCGPSIVPEHATDTTGDPAMTITASGTTSTPPSTTGGPPPPGSTSTDPDGGSEDPSTSDGSTFISRSDVPPSYQCDFFEQDCPPGEKCVPIDDDGSGGPPWNALRCRSVVPDPVGPSEHCTTMEGLRGPVDDCDDGSRCIDGVCRAFCLGSERSPVCEEPGVACLIFNDPWGFCFSPCDPLAQDDCPEGDACYPDAGNLSCVPNGSNGMGPPGTPCELSPECNPGSWCADDSDVPGCPSSGCCSSLCALDDPMPPCLPGQSCVPWDPGDPTSNIGICVVV